MLSRPWATGPKMQAPRGTRSSQVRSTYGACFSVQQEAEKWIQYNRNRTVAPQGEARGGVRDRLLRHRGVRPNTIVHHNMLL